MLSDDENERRHQEFYNAIRSEDILLLDTLLSKWSHVGECQLDENLSRAYDELKLKNVPLSHKIENYVENKLLDFRFFSNITTGQDQSNKSDIDKIKERRNLILESISMLTSDYSESEKVDEKFLFIAKFISKNMHTLKRQLKSTYTILPWEEIEFCLVIFISFHTKQQEMNLIYSATLNKRKILNHLEIFAEQLKKVILQGNKLHVLPRVKRDNVILNIIDSCSQFEDLYNDYHQIRDVYSLQKMSDYIYLAVSTDPLEKEGQLIITRALQVIGENLKNTLESPKLSHTTSQLLMLSLRKNVREIIVALRDSISHVESLSRRMEIESKANSDFCNIQNDLRIVGEAITVILYKHKIQMVQLLLEIIIDSEDLDVIVEVLEQVSAFKLDEMAKTNNFAILVPKTLKGLVKNLCDKIEDKTNFEEKLFNEINEIISFGEIRLQNIRFDYVTQFRNIRNLSILFNENISNENLLRIIKINATTALQNTIDIEPPEVKKINYILFEVLNSLEFRKPGDEFNDLKLICGTIILEIYDFLTIVAGRIDWIEALRKKLQLKDPFVAKTECKNNSNNITECNKLLQLKLLDLNNILSKNSLVVEQKSLIKSERKLQAALEMLLLDIMSILGISKYYLKNNALFIDDNTPLLHGTCLRNHIAHDNAIVDILCDFSIAVILNAKKISKEENIIVEREKTIGKLIHDNPDKLREQFHRGLVTIINKEEMFDVLKEGQLEAIQDCLKKGADVTARNTNLWTTLHFAAMGSSLQVIKFILDRNISVNVKDSKGQTPFHIAAAHGRHNIVDFFILEKGLNVDEVDNRSRTPLHAASRNGNQDTVELLLKHKANAVAQDSSGYPPLHHAIRNNHIDIVKILLKKYVNGDINRTMGGLAPLHDAAEHGNLQLVKLLLKNGADVNVIGTRKNDVILSPLHTVAFIDHMEDACVPMIYEQTPILNERDIFDFTPLHSAAEHGHDDICNVLLENGACVHSIDKYYATPLHYAVSYGYEKIVNLLLKNNANPNATVVKERTPLHMAVWSYHLKIVAALIKHGVDINAKDIYSKTPLHAAATGGDRSIVELLINNGSDINAKSIKNLTALHVATLMGREDVTELLITNNADVNAQDLQGITPLFIAAIHGNTNIINLLIKKNAEVNIRYNDARTPLHGASAAGHIGAVDFLIKNNADINTTDHNGFTPLYFAIVNDHVHIVNLLIDSGAQVNTSGNFGCTPLHAAAYAGRIHFIDLLIKKNADVNIRDANGTTPLHDASATGNIKVVDFLIKSNADVNARDNDGSTALHCAVENGYQDIVNLLIDCKAEIDIGANDGSSPLHQAAQTGNTTVLDILIKRKAEVNIKEFDGKTPLHRATSCGHIEAVHFLIRNNADISARDYDGWTSLHYAVKIGHPKIVKLLIDGDAQIDITASYGLSSLHLAAIAGNINILNLLIKRNAEVNHKSDNGSTALHEATVNNHIEAVHILIKNNADVNAQNNDGMTALHYAAENGFEDIVNLLIDCEAEIDIVASDGRSSLHEAALTGFTNVLDILIKRNAKVNIRAINGMTPLHEAIAGGHIEAVNFLIKSNADVNARDNVGFTILHYAVLECHEEIVNLLLDGEAQVDASDNNIGSSPLRIAAESGDINIINLLIKRNAEVNIRAINGMTPLHRASAGGHIEAVYFLIKNNAEVNAKNNDGDTPLDFAVQKGHEDIVKLLTDSEA